MLGDVRDVFVILGIPSLMGIGLQLHHEQLASLKAANEAQAAQIQLLKETQYDKALSQIKAQRELFEAQIASYSNRIQILERSASTSSNEIRKLRQDIDQKQKMIETLKKAKDILQNWRNLPFDSINKPMDDLQ